MPSAPRRYRPPHQRTSTGRSKAGAARHKFYDTAAWRGRSLNGVRVGGLRQARLEMDGNICQDCNAMVSGKSAHVDHVIPIEQRPDLATDIGNLRTRCDSCHSKKTQAERR